MNSLSDKRTGWGVMIGVPALFLCAYVYARLPSIQNIPLCTVKHFLGVDCPGCGLTRSFAMLSLGEFRRSVDFHPLGIITAGFLLWMFAETLISRVTKRRLSILKTSFARDLLLYAFLTALIAQWVLKLIILHAYPVAFEPVSSPVLDLLSSAT